MSAQLCMAKAQSKDFQDRVKFFAQKSSISIMNEDIATVNHADRVTFAHSILSGQADIYELAIGVTTNPTIEANINIDVQVPDGDIEFSINSIFDAFAG